MASQYLTKKASGPRAVVKVSEGCCGINSQDFLESFSSFWARVDGFRDSDLHSELRPKGGLVRTWTVRSTMHTIPAKDYWVHVFGGPAVRFQPLFDRVARQRGIPDKDFRVSSLYQPFLNHIKGRAVTTNEVREYMVERLSERGLKGKMRLARGWSSKPTYGPSWSGLSEMSYLGLLVNAGRKGSESLWMSSDDWLNSGRRVPDHDECVVELVRKYIVSYGPVSRDDITYWSFLLKRQVDAALEALDKELTKTNFAKEEYYSFDGDVGDVGEPPGTVILPEFDNLMMGYKDKSRFMSHDLIKKVFWGFGGIHRTILIDGFVSAIWKRKKEHLGVTVSVTPLRSLKGAEKRSIEDAFAGYADYQGTSYSVVFAS